MEIFIVAVMLASSCNPSHKPHFKGAQLLSYRVPIVNHSNHPDKCFTILTDRVSSDGPGHKPTETQETQTLEEYNKLATKEITTPNGQIVTMMPLELNEEN